MPKYTIPAIQELEKQLAFAPAGVREEQLDNIEQLIHELDAGMSYPYEFVCFKITAYRPAADLGKSFEGAQLRHDLCVLLDRLSETVNTPADQPDEPVYTVDDVKRICNVSTRTVFRWREQGLVSRKYVFGDRKRTGIRKSALDAFTAQHADQIERSSNFSRLSKPEKQRIVARAKVLASQGMNLSRAADQISAETGRSREAIRYTLRNFDKQQPANRIFEQKTPRLSDHEKLALCRDYFAGYSMAALVQKFGRSRSALYRAINQMRAEKLLSEPTPYVYDASFDQPDADAVILRDNSAFEGTGHLKPVPMPKNAPAYMRPLYSSPLLTKEQEICLFRRYNYLKYRIAQMKGMLAGGKAKASIIANITDLQKQAIAVKNQIVRANLRLVVSVAKRHTGPLTNLGELISEGNVCLMRAVEKFDFSRGFKFSTYATWALVKTYARSIPEENYHLSTFVTGQDELLAEHGDDSVEATDEREFTAALRHVVSGNLKKLSERERRIIVSRFGLGQDDQPKTLEEIGRLFGLTRERIRQIEARALKKLKALLRDPIAELGVV